MSKFTHDVRVDTLAIGFVNALAWYFAYPVFVAFLSIAGVFGDVLRTPFLALFSLVAIPMLLLFLALSLMPVAFASLVTYSVAFVIRYAYRYRLENASGRSVVNLGATYSAISIAVFGIGVAFLPPTLTDQERQLYEWLWPMGAIFVTIVLSIASATITYRLLR